MPLYVRRRIRSQAPFLTIVGIVVAAFVYLTLQPGHWVRATIAVAVAMLLAAALRVTLPGARVGMLAVRGRWLDTVCYVGLGVLILIADIRLRH